jgi:hypothetical protein
VQQTIDTLGPHDLCAYAGVPYSTLQLLQEQLQSLEQQEAELATSQKAMRKHRDELQEEHQRVKKALQVERQRQQQQQGQEVQNDPASREGCGTGADALDAGDGGVEVLDGGCGSSLACLQQRLSQLKQQYQEVVRDARAVPGKLHELQYQRQQLQLDLTRLCAIARNAFSRERLRGDYKEAAAHVQEQRAEARKKARAEAAAAMREPGAMLLDLTCFDDDDEQEEGKVEELPVLCIR